MNWQGGPVHKLYLEGELEETPLVLHDFLTIFPDVLDLNLTINCIDLSIDEADIQRLIDTLSRSRIRRILTGDGIVDILLPRLQRKPFPTLVEINFGTHEEDWVKIPTLVLATVSSLRSFILMSDK
ncbi:hypothetical protein OBBRIDRAFT_804022 [Obba rivulosa]|uniref:Uncharacterized protein n=1 Tax=Obba rivulosa TaxID=1052685 RepID=A0A8E2AY86_9APHY|nr:hypothetical protein OBBRIDRAFT_804022 [Obba rivulosa]